MHFLYLLVFIIKRTSRQILRKYGGYLNMAETDFKTFDNIIYIFNTIVYKHIYIYMIAYIYYKV